MAVFRIEKNRQYTAMSKHHLKDNNLSLRAKGLLSVMLSLPENWDYSMAGLTKICKEDRPKIKSTLNELKEMGYVRIIKINAEGTGKFEYEYNIYESPEDKKPETEKPALVEPGMEKWSLAQPNIELNNKKEEIIKEEKRKIIKETNKEIVEYLNYRAGTHYKDTTPKTRELIQARINEGYTLEDFKQVIDTMTREWLGNDKMQRYLRPETLFSNKFEGYLNMKPRKITTKDIAQKIDITELLAEGSDEEW